MKKVGKIICEKDKGLTTKDLWFHEIQIYLCKGKSYKLLSRWIQDLQLKFYFAKGILQSEKPSG
jgi:hypothetical protein